MGPEAAAWVLAPREQDVHVMIRLTRLNNRPLVVNSDLIKFIENAPDTVITLVTGEKIVVLESAQEVISRIVEYRRWLRAPQVAAPPENSVAPPDPGAEPRRPEASEEPSEIEG
jgi:flagellar protein FlbD